MKFTWWIPVWDNQCFNETETVDVSDQYVNWYYREHPVWYYYRTVALKLKNELLLHQMKGLLFIHAEDWTCLKITT